MNGFVRQHQTIGRGAVAQLQATNQQAAPIWVVFLPRLFGRAVRNDEPSSTPSGAVIEDHLAEEL